MACAPLEKTPQLLVSETNMDKDYIYSNTAYCKNGKGELLQNI